MEQIKVTEFDVMINDRGDMLLAMQAFDDEHVDENPVLVIDGPNVMINRNPDHVVHLDTMSDDLLEKLKAQTEVFIVETDDNGIVREYMADVMIDREGNEI